MRRPYHAPVIPRGWKPLARWGLAGGVAAALLGATTVLVWLLQGWLGLTDASAAYLLAVTAVAVLFGPWAAVLGAVAAFGLYNFLFTHPLYTFIVADSGQLLNLVLLLVVGVVVGQLAGAQRERAELAEARRREAVVVSQVSRALANRQDTAAAASTIVDILLHAVGARAIWIGLGSAPGRERRLAATGTSPPETPAIHAVLQRRPGDEPARWMRVHPPGPPGRAGADAAPAYRVPIEAAGNALGGIWISREAAAGEPRREEVRMLAAAADQIGQALEQDRLRSEASRADLAKRSEALKSALLESVSHDLRTPLAAIRASAGLLLDAGTAADVDALRETAQVIDDEAARMDRLVANLLDMSRIEAGEVAIDLQPYALDDLIEGSISRFRAQSTGGSLAVDTPSDLPYVLADAILMDQVIVNLLDNAARHAADAPVRVTASMENDRLRLIVEDGGPGVPAEGMARLFDKFYQVPGSRPSARRGTGLGLAVVRGLVEAMGGQVDAHPSELGGLAISIALQTSPAPSEDA